MEILHFFVMALILGGIAFLCISLSPLPDILRMIRRSPLRHWWIGLSALIPLFIMGYMSFAWSHHGTSSNMSDLIVALILFVGACFVVGVVFLARNTAKDVLRIATLERDAFVDPLTGLYNRRYASSRLDGEIARAHRYGLDLCALMIDIDHFKQVNDEYGHQAGDEVIRRIAGAIIAGSRPSDMVVRYGGEEILLIAPNIIAAAAAVLAERVRQTIEATVIEFEDELITVTVSIGLSSLIAGDDAVTLIERADRSLYQAKNSGRNCVRYLYSDQKSNPGISIDIGEMAGGIN